MDSERCPRCGLSTAIAGRMVLSNKSGTHRFEPGRFATFRWWGRAPACSSDVRACLGCGLVWTQLDPEELRAFVGKHGGPEAKDRLSHFHKAPPDPDLA
jgi:hypothetical protein